MTGGETDLASMLGALRPVRRPGEFVYVSVPGGAPPAGMAFEAAVREDEGLTLVLRREDADAAALAYDFVGAWISLSVHSALEAVGLTGAFATALTRAGISCNVLAGAFHDHVLVPVADADRALDALEALARTSTGSKPPD